jgi:hypothetical protein
MILSLGMLESDLGYDGDLSYVGDLSYNGDPGYNSASKKYADTPDKI